MVDRAKNVMRTPTCLSPPVKDERHNDGFKTRNPDQTPVRLQLLQHLWWPIGPWLLG